MSFMPDSPNTRRRAVRPLAWGFVLVSLTWSAGCGSQGKLFPDEASRSPYDRYGLLRGRFVDKRVRGPSGFEQPNLRERLQPLESP